MVEAGPFGGMQRPAGPEIEQLSLAERLRTLRHIGRLVAQIWQTSRTLTVTSIALRLVRAVQPVAMLYVGKLIIDEVVRQTGLPHPGDTLGEWLESGRLAPLLWLLGAEFAL